MIESVIKTDFIFLYFYDFDKFYILKKEFLMKKTDFLKYVFKNIKISNFSFFKNLGKFENFIFFKYILGNPYFK